MYIPAFFRFYKGELVSPYTGDKDSLWFYERAWMLDMSTNDGKEDLTNCIDEYASAGLLDFSTLDSIPISFKALLFNRYAKNYQSMVDAVDNFKLFYEKFYGA